MSTKIQNPELKSVYSGLTKQVNDICLQIQQSIKGTLTSIELPDLEVMSKIGDFSFKQDENGRPRYCQNSPVYSNPYCGILSKRETKWLSKFRIGLNNLNISKRDSNFLDYGSKDILFYFLTSPKNLSQKKEQESPIIIEHKGIFSDIEGNLIVLPFYNEHIKEYDGPFLSTGGVHEPKIWETHPYIHTFRINYLDTYIREDGQIIPKNSYSHIKNLDESTHIKYIQDIVEGLDNLKTNGTNPEMAETILQKLIKEKEAKEEKEKRVERREKRKHKKQIKEEYEKLFRKK